MAWFRSEKSGLSNTERTIRMESLPIRGPRREVRRHRAKERSRLGCEEPATETTWTPLRWVGKLEIAVDLGLGTPAWGTDDVGDLRNTCIRTSNSNVQRTTT
ncbi:hypothetical protein ACRALDRAFT_2036398 [Sodiomyces alcalophilus JCM 7366]|uniref:uncharacterized protein n=1 Tax=Sodiomyces alcalophilus JCM 7366 TaxID=591952 RepID=UPI0039B5D206